MLKIFIPGLALLLAGCQSTGLFKSDDSQPLLVPVGSSITLHQPLVFEIGYSRSFIQFGKPVRVAELRKRYPYCRFYRYEHPDEMQQERTLRPDTFRVSRSYRAMDLPLTGGSGIIFGADAEGFGPPDDNTHNSILKLQSESQPEIVELRCAVLTEPSIGNYLTIAEIQQILGDTVSIAMP